MSFLYIWSLFPILLYMVRIRNVVFDLGGVLIDLDRDCAVRHFEEIGVADAEHLIDAYEQKGIRNLVCG